MSENNKGNKLATIIKKTNPNSTEGEVVDTTNELISQNEIQEQKMKKMIQERLGNKIMKKKNEKAEINSVKQEGVQATLVNPKYDGYLKELKPYIDENKTLIKEVYSRTVRLTFNYIQMGNILTIAKDNLSKDDFKRLYEYYDLEKRTVYRYINLVKDNRVSNLSIGELSTMLKPSMNKLIKMSKLKDDEDFTTVMSGEDTPLLSLNVDKDNSNPFSTYLDDNTYKNLNKMTKVEIIEFFIDELTKKDNVCAELNSENEYLIDIVQSNNLYDTKEEVA